MSEAGEEALKLVQKKLRRKKVGELGRLRGFRVRGFGRCGWDNEKKYQEVI